MLHGGTEGSTARSSENKQGSNGAGSSFTPPGIVPLSPASQTRHPHLAPTSPATSSANARQQHPHQLEDRRLAAEQGSEAGGVATSDVSQTQLSSTGPSESATGRSMAASSVNTNALLQQAMRVVSQDDVTPPNSKSGSKTPGILVNPEDDGMEGAQEEGGGGTIRDDEQSERWRKWQERKEKKKKKKEDAQASQASASSKGRRKSTGYGDWLKGNSDGYSGLNSSQGRTRSAEEMGSVERSLAADQLFDSGLSDTASICSEMSRVSRTSEIISSPRPAHHFSHRTPTLSRANSSDSQPRPFERSRYSNASDDPDRREGTFSPTGAATQSPRVSFDQEAEQERSSYRRWTSDSLKGEETSVGRT